MPATRAPATRLIPALVATLLVMLTGCATTVAGTPQRAGGTVASPATSAPATPGTSPTVTAPSSGPNASTGPIPPVPPVPPSGSAGPTSPSQPSNPSQPTHPASPGGSTGPSKPAGPAQWTFTVVRHADRADDGTDDPPLTDAGDNRADRLADLLQPQHGVAVYASPYRRAQQTAMPTSVAWDVPVTTYDPTDAPEVLLSQVVLEHPSGAVLIVGHSDTVPGIVGVLCGCSIDAIADDDFGKLYQVSLDANGAVVDFHTLDSY